MPTSVVLFQQRRLPGNLGIVKVVLLRQVVIELSILIIVVALWTHQVSHLTAKGLTIRCFEITL